MTTRHCSTFVFCFFIGSMAAASEAVVDVTLNPMGSFKAKTGEVKGEAVVFGDTVKAENVIVTLRNIKTGIALRDKHATEKYLDVAKFPDATLLQATGKGGKGRGRLKIRGIENEVSGTYKIKGKELHAEFQVKLSAFGITGIKYMGVGVSDEIRIHIVLPIVRKRAGYTANP